MPTRRASADRPPPSSSQDVRAAHAAQSGHPHEQPLSLDEERAPEQSAGQVGLHSVALLQATLDSIPTKIAVLDGSAEVLLTNRAWDQSVIAGDGDVVGVGGNYLDAFAVAEAHAPGNPGAGLRSVIFGTTRQVSVEHTVGDRTLSLNAMLYEGPGDGHVVVAHHDTTERVQDRRKLLSTRNYLRAVTDSMAEGMFTLDVEGRVTYMNQASETLLGWSRHDLLGRRMHPITHSVRADGSELPASECQILATCRTGDVSRIDDEVFVDRSGRALPVAYTASPLISEGSVEGCVVVFEDISERRVREEALRMDAEKLQVLDRIRVALADDMFVLYAQPIIDLETGDTVQRELLLRMCEPDGNVVGPGAFIEAAEQYGLIADIDRWVIRQAARLVASGRPAQINISSRTLGDLTTLDYIARSLEREGTDPSLLVFEITETAIVADEALALAFAKGLQELGCGLALDDFGTGYGSFTYLKHLPVDYLKIDIEFVRDVVSSPASRHVVQAVVSLADSFGLRTVAEGVEDHETLDVLRALGVDFAQGFHIGRPAPPQRPVEGGLAQVA